MYLLLGIYLGLNISSEVFLSMLIYNAVKNQRHRTLIVIYFLGILESLNNLSYTLVHLSEVLAPIPILVEPDCVWNAYFTAWLQLVNMFFYVFLAVNLWWVVNRASSGTDADKQFFWYYMGFGFGIPVVMVVTLYFIEEDIGWHNVRANSFFCDVYINTKSLFRNAILILTGIIVLSLTGHVIVTVIMHRARYMKDNIGQSSVGISVLVRMTVFSVLYCIFFAGSQIPALVTSISQPEPPSQVSSKPGFDEMATGLSGIGYFIIFGTTKEFFSTFCPCFFYRDPLRDVFVEPSREPPREPPNIGGGRGREIRSSISGMSRALQLQYPQRTQAAAGEPRREFIPLDWRLEEETSLSMDWHSLYSRDDAV